MALTELKSDLSTFRKPIERPLIENQSVEINRKSNFTPISDLSNRITSPTPLKETPVKSVVTPNLFDNTEKFLGQTTPNKFSLESKFLGETTPTEVNNTEKFLGQTTPNKFNLESNFLGQTTPTEVDNTEKFKGQTTPNKFSLESKFLGETDPKRLSLESKFLGETTPTEVDNTEKFKGQTTPTNFTFIPQYTTPKLGSVDFFPNTNADGFTKRMEESRFNFSSLSSPTPMTLEGKFLGETDPNKMSLESKFLGQTTPTPIDSTEKFKGQTTPSNFTFTPQFTTTTPSNFTFTPQFTATTPINFTFTPQFTTTTPSNFTFTPQFTTPTLKIVDFISNTDAKGFTAKMKRTRSQFVDINSRQNTFTERIKNSRLGLVNFFPNDDAKGFTKNFVDKTKSQFRGISADGKKFKSPKVTFSGDFGLSFLPGNKIKLEGSAAKYYKIGNQKWQPGGKRYEAEYVSIGDLLIRENSPSYLTKVYSQFNLQDDSFNPNTLFGFRQPFILRGIQRKGDSKKEPQKWGFGSSLDSITGGIDLIRGGVLTSTERAIVDVARIGQFLLSPKGIVWSIMQIGMQRTNKFNKVWTPLNLLLAVGGQHIGLKPKRHGLLPFDFKDTGRYERLTPIGGSKYKDKLEGLRNNAVVLGGLGIGSNIVPLEVQPGGPESVYGIGRTRIDTSTNTFSNAEKTYGDTKAEFVQKYNPIFKTDKEGKVLMAPAPSPIDNIETNNNTYGIEFGVITNNLGGSRKDTTDLSKLGLLNKIINFNYPFQLIDNFGNSLYTNQSGNTNTHWTQKYSPILDTGSGSTIRFGFDKTNKGENTYGKLFDVGDGNVGSVYKDLQDEYKKLGLASISYDESKIPSTGYQQMWEDNNPKSQKLKKIFGGDAILNYSEIQEFAKGGPYKTFNDFRSKYKEKQLSLKNFLLKNYVKDYEENPDGKYYEKYNIEKRLGLGNSDKKIGIAAEGENNSDLIKLSFTTAGVGTIQFRGTVNSINETFTPTWTEIKYSGRAENAYIYDTFVRELNFSFRVYAYSVGELKPMWQRLEKLGKMAMPTYGESGYYGNITKFTLGTMYEKFPVLISSLQYAVLDEFTWEIGLNKGASDNVLPMGVDVTIGLKLLNKELHKTNATKIYDYKLTNQ